MASNPIALRPSPPAQRPNYSLPSMVAPARSRPREPPGIHRLKATSTMVTGSDHRLRGSHRGICNVSHPTILRRGSTPPPPLKPASKLLAPMWPGGASHRPPSPEAGNTALRTNVCQTVPDVPLFHLFRLADDPRLPFWELTQIPIGIHSRRSWFRGRCEHLIGI